MIEVIRWNDRGHIKAKRGFVPLHLGYMSRLERYRGELLQRPEQRRRETEQPFDHRPCVIALPQAAHGRTARGTQEQQRERKVAKSPAHVHHPTQLTLLEQRTHPHPRPPCAQVSCFLSRPALCITWK